MSMMNQKLMRFVLRTTEGPLEIMRRFLPQGKAVLNRTEWRGKEPRSCGITNVIVRPYHAGSKEPRVVDIEVTYRPMGCIVFVGNTKYDGWTALVLDKKSDGTLLDGHGNPLLDGHPPVYLRYEVHADAEFNEMDFGEFVGEYEIGGVKHVRYDDWFRQLQASGSFGGSINSTFMAPRRHRPLVKIILSDAPSSVGMDGFGTRIVNVNRQSQHLQRVIVDELTELVSGFVEGRYSIKSMGNDDSTLAQLSDSFVDCSEPGKSRFNCLSEFVPDNFLEELAKRLMSVYEVDVCVVDGPEGGLLLRNIDDSHQT